METLVQELEVLKASAMRLEQEIKDENDKEKEIAKRTEVTALYNCIAALNIRIAELQKEKNILLQQSRGNFL